MLKICITYDYELFMGKNNDTPEKILFAPTKALSDTMLSNGVKGSFFVDVCSAMVHKEYGLTQYSEGFESQVQDLIKSGHDVQLHVHTSWLKAKNNNKQLELTSDGYRIHEFGFDESNNENVFSIIKNSVEYLKEIAVKADPNYKCIAYRAGGFCLQPEEQLIDILLDNGIVIDSSIVPNLKQTNSVNYFDYSKVPNKLNWFFSSNGGVSKCDDYGLFEVPLAFAKPRLLECIFTKKEDRSLPVSKIKGEYVKFNGYSPLKKGSYLKKIFGRLFGYRLVSLDSRNYKAVIKDLNYFYKKYNLSKKDGYICMICHPKIADKVRIENMDSFIKSVLSQSDKFKFVTMSQIANELFLEEK